MSRSDFREWIIDSVNHGSAETCQVLLDGNGGGLCDSGAGKEGVAVQEFTESFWGGEVEIHRRDRFYCHKIFRSLLPSAR